MIVTQLTRDAFAMFKYAKELRASGDHVPQMALEQRFGRDPVNFVAMVLFYKRLWRKHKL